MEWVLVFAAVCRQLSWFVAAICVCVLLAQFDGCDSCFRQSQLCRLLLGNSCGCGSCDGCDTQRFKQLGVADDYDQMFYGPPFPRCKVSVCRLLAILPLVHVMKHNKMCFEIKLGPCPEHRSTSYRLLVICMYLRCSHWSLVVLIPTAIAAVTLQLD
jgi:hypothetical protein